MTATLKTVVTKAALLENLHLLVKVCEGGGGRQWGRHKG